MINKDTNPYEKALMKS